MQNSFKNKKYLIPDSKCNKYNLKQVPELRKLVKNFKLETKNKPLKKDLLQILTDYFNNKYFDIVSNKNKRYKFSYIWKNYEINV